MTEISTLGQRIKHRRTALRLSLNRLGEISKISPATLFRLEKGEVSNLRSDSLERLSKSLKTSTDFLLGRSPTPATSSDEHSDYLFQMYNEMSPSRINQLIGFAEYTRWKSVPYKQLLDAFHALYEIFSRHIDPKKLEGRELVEFDKVSNIIGLLVIDRAEREVEAEG